MTQKELLYLEDAIGHEKNMISICTESINYLDDSTLVTFMECEIKRHDATLKKLLKKLKECCE